MIEEMMLLLINEGATPASAAAAAVILDAGGSVKEARAILVEQPVNVPVASFSVELLLAQARRERVVIQTRRTA